MSDEKQQAVPMATLGVEGNTGFALLGTDLQNGEVEFVEFEPATSLRMLRLNQCGATERAFHNLKTRLNLPEMLWQRDPSHPDADGGKFNN